MIFVILALQGKAGKINILSKGLYTTLYAEYLKVFAFLFGTNLGVTEENWRWILIRLDGAELSRSIRRFNHILVNLSLFFNQLYLPFF